MLFINSKILLRRSTLYVLHYSVTEAYFSTVKVPWGLVVDLSHRRIQMSDTDTDEWTIIFLYTKYFT